MFEVTKRGETTTVKTKAGVFKIKYSDRYSRYQVFKAPSKAIFDESFYGYKGALDIVAKIAATSC